MKNILLLSDTHGYMGQEIIKHAKEVDEIWHAGDIGAIHVSDELQEYGTLRAVYGNIDGTEIRNKFPLHNRFMCEKVEVLITHIGGYPSRYSPKIYNELKENPPKLFICGHSHILKVVPDPKMGLLHMNPGAIGKYGFHKVRTMLKFKIEKDRIFDLVVIEYKK
ncbi:MAG: metallophosphoesterase family protein [Flavobacteriales bacterium]